ncbi:uncharacterized protein LOC135348323 [Halichondria panicea]|uniref:uncharacterized protein LOC135348323 n=1 Tax=Halichondria panicea TaxID=6063 RepID=UPI00312B5979
MSLKLNIDIVVVFYFASLSAITAQYSVSAERPCPMETVTFTCTAPGDSLRWVPSDTSAPITVRNTIDLNVSLMQSGYTVKLTAFNDTTLTSTLSRTAENGITVSCVGFVPVSTIGSSTVQLVEPPGPPSTIIRHSTPSSSANEVNVTIDWDLPAETGGKDDLTYTVTISSLTQLSATVLTSTSVTVTTQYNVDYTVSVVATNCAGNSTTAEYSFRIVSCVLPAPPLNGTLLNTNSQNTSLTEGSVITFQCDPGFSLVGVATATCNNSGLWDPDPALFKCSYPETGNVTAVAGGVVGSIVIMVLIILVVIVLLVVLRGKREESVRLKSNDSMEMDDKFDATVEPVIYAALSSCQPRKKGNTTATVDHHQVTYATVDADATRKQAAKTVTIPASPTASASADVDKLLDIDQALVQIRSMKHKWRELAETMRLPETLIEQIEDSCCNDSAGCLTEVINQWSCSGQPTWRELTNHLSKIGEEQLAKELMTIYDISCLPVELSSCLAAPKTLHKYDKTSPLPSQFPTVTDDSPVLLNTLPPSRPPKLTGEMVPARPPKPAPNIEPPAPPHPFKH